MPVFNTLQREVNVKIVYYGPGLSGKTTNLQYIHGSVRPDLKRKLVSLATQTDRTLFFDFLPLELGVLKGYKVRLHLYTVPGQVHYNATRKLVLKGVDGIVFVADSQRAMLEANLESIQNLERNLHSYGRALADIPYLIQANKRDLDDLAPIDEMDSVLNNHGVQLVEAVASRGDGVLETLTRITRKVMEGLSDRFQSTGETAGSLAVDKAPADQPDTPAADGAPEDNAPSQPAVEEDNVTCDPVSVRVSVPGFGHMDLTLRIVVSVQGEGGPRIVSAKAALSAVQPEPSLPEGSPGPPVSRRDGVDRAVSTGERVEGFPPKQTPPDNFVGVDSKGPDVHGPGITGMDAATFEEGLLPDEPGLLETEAPGEGTRDNSPTDKRKSFLGFLRRGGS